MGNLWQQPLKEIVADYDPGTHPIIGPLMEGGPVALVERYDLPHEDTYIDACHLCYLARDALRTRFPEISGPCDSVRRSLGKRRLQPIVTPGQRAGVLRAGTETGSWPCWDRRNGFRRRPANPGGDRFHRSESHMRPPQPYLHPRTCRRSIPSVFGARHPQVLYPDRCNCRPSRGPVNAGSFPGPEMPLALTRPLLTAASDIGTGPEPAGTALGRREAAPLR